MDLSIIIPVWNEAGKIENDLEKLVRFFKTSELQAEIIVTDDGSTDDTTKAVKDLAMNQQTDIKLVSNSPHRGKGCAVRSGILKSSGKYVMFMDSGGTVPLNYIHKGLKHLLNDDCDVAIGSRHHPESVIRKNLVWYRQLTSRLFRFAVRRYLHTPHHISDTQCGFKLYKGDIGREIFKSCSTDGFLFDLECILIAQSKGYRQQEFPIEWTCDRDSRLSILKSLYAVLKELRELKQRYKT